MSAFSPLTWPPNFDRASRTERFLRDVPLVGLNSRVRKNIQSQMEARLGSDYAAVWQPFEVDLSVRDRVSEMICASFQWPNPFYSPADPCEILLWDCSGVMTNVRFLIELEACFNIELTENDTQGTYFNLVYICAQGPRP